MYGPRPGSAEAPGQCRRAVGGRPARDGGVSGELWGSGAILRNDGISTICDHNRAVLRGGPPWSGWKPLQNLAKLEILQPALFCTTASAVVLVFIKREEESEEERGCRKTPPPPPPWDQL